MRELKALGTETTFFFSDIDSKFYEKLGFKPLSPRFQLRKDSVCMVSGVDPVRLEAEPGFNSPGYF
ncbi:MAG: hypothetical protein H7222_04475 [Methylotenera sp.]|nr:hypothetical protein [Oligoflexia bacterium]